MQFEGNYMEKTWTLINTQLLLTGQTNLCWEWLQQRHRVTALVASGGSFQTVFFTALSTMWSDQLFHCHTCHQDPCCLHRDRIEPILPMSLCLAPQFVQIFTLLTASTLVLPQTSATQDLQVSFDLLSQFLVPLVPLWHRHRLPSPYHCKQGQAADGPHVCRRQI